MVTAHVGLVSPQGWPDDGHTTHSDEASDFVRRHTWTCKLRYPGRRIILLEIRIKMMSSRVFHFSFFIFTQLKVPKLDYK